MIRIHKTAKNRTIIAYFWVSIEQEKEKERWKESLGIRIRQLTLSTNEHIEKFSVCGLRIYVCRIVHFTASTRECQNGRNRSSRWNECKRLLSPSTGQWATQLHRERQFLRGAKEHVM